MKGGRCRPPFLCGHTIRQITPAGVVTTFAGLAGTPGSVDGTSTAARFNAPSCVAMDSGGNVFVADTGNHAIRKITSEGVVTTLAGLAGTPGATDGTGSVARFSGPISLAVDAWSNVYVADTGNHTIRRITPSGVVTTVAGSVGTSGFVDGAGTAALFHSPQGVAVDAANNTYVYVDGSNVSHYAYAANIYVADTVNNTIRKITATPAFDASGNMTSTAYATSTLAGSAGISGFNDGTGTSARFNGPSSLAVDVSGNVKLADTGNLTIRQITSEGVVTTLAGLTGNAGSTDGFSDAARFNVPSGLVVNDSAEVKGAAEFALPVPPSSNLVLTLVLKGNTLTSIQNGATLLAANTDYVVSGSVLTLNWSYLNTLPSGATTLQINFDHGAFQQLKLNK